MNEGEMVAALRDVASTKSITLDEANDLLKDGILAGLARIHGPNVQAEINIDEVTGKVEIIVLRRVVEVVEDPSSEISLEEASWDDDTFEVGDVMEVPVDFTKFGRNAVMAVKQSIVQRVREGERQRIRDEFTDRVSELLSGEVQQIERGKIVVMLNRSRDAEAIIPWKEQNPRERFRQGDPIRAVLKKVEETPKGPRLILSRADPLFVAALFKLEVPEIYQGIVELREIAREVGGRSKIAVSSRDDSIDPVGACVGLKGSRVQAVVAELGGERIDIVPWHPDTEVFARRALAPARVAKVISNPDRQVIIAIVDEDQLSLAIGRNGQNVRLARMAGKGRRSVVVQRARRGTARDGGLPAWRARPERNHPSGSRSCRVQYISKYNRLGTRRIPAYRGLVGAGRRSAPVHHRRFDRRRW
jgi:N utilization substance protein A